MNRGRWRFSLLVIFVLLWNEQVLAAEYPLMWFSVNLNRWVWLLRVFFTSAAIIGFWVYKSARRRRGPGREED